MPKFFVKMDNYVLTPANKYEEAVCTMIRTEFDRKLLGGIEALDYFIERMEEYIRRVGDQYPRCKAIPFDVQFERTDAEYGRIRIGHYNFLKIYIYQVKEGGEQG